MIDQYLSWLLIFIFYELIRPYRRKFQICCEILVGVLFQPNYEREKKYP